MHFETISDYLTAIETWLVSHFTALETWMTWPRAACVIASSVAILLCLALIKYGPSVWKKHTERVRRRKRIEHEGIRLESLRKWLWGDFIPRVNRQTRKGRFEAIFDFDPQNLRRRKEAKKWRQEIIIRVFILSREIARHANPRSRGKKALQGYSEAVGHLTEALEALRDWNPRVRGELPHWLGMPELLQKEGIDLAAVEKWRREKSLELKKSMKPIELNGSHTRGLIEQKSRS